MFERVVIINWTKGQDRRSFMTCRTSPDRSHNASKIKNIAMGTVCVTYRVLMGNPERRDHLIELDIDGRIMRRWVL